MLKERLESFENNISTTSSIVRLMFSQAVKAVRNKDIELAKKVMMADLVVSGDKMEKDNLTVGTRLIARFQPTGSDMRRLVGGILVNSYLEKIGKYSINISKKVKTYSEISDEFIPQSFFKMLEFGKEIFDNCVYALLNRDEEVADDVISAEVEMNKVYRYVEREVVKDICSGEIEPKVKMNIINIAQNVERVGDQSENISMTTLFIMGSNLYFDSSKNLLREIG